MGVVRIIVNSIINFNTCVCSADVSVRVSYLLIGVVRKWPRRHTSWQIGQGLRKTPPGGAVASGA